MLLRKLFHIKEKHRFKTMEELPEQTREKRKCLKLIGLSFLKRIKSTP